MEKVIEYLKSKNPVVIATSIVIIILSFITTTFSLFSKLNNFTNNYETKIEHKEDIVQLSEQEDLKHRLLAAEIAVQVVEKVEKLHHNHSK